MIAVLLDIIYVLIFVLALPWLIFKAVRTGKYRAGLVEKFFGTVPARDTDRPCVWFHAVSVGEVLLLRRVVAALAERRPDAEIVISTTTNTGMEVGGTAAVLATIVQGIVVVSVFLAVAEGLRLGIAIEQNTRSREQPSLPEREGEGGGR